MLVSAGDPCTPYTPRGGAPDLGCAYLSCPLLLAPSEAKGGVTLLSTSGPSPRPTGCSILIPAPCPFCPSKVAAQWHLTPGSLVPTRMVHGARGCPSELLSKSCCASPARRAAIVVYDSQGQQVTSVYSILKVRPEQQPVAAGEAAGKMGPRSIPLALLAPSTPIHPHPALAPFPSPRPVQFMSAPCS